MDLSELIKLTPRIPLEAVPKLQAFMDEVKTWNEKINLISRKDIEFLQEKHLMPSLAIGAACPFLDGTRVLDVGTGGGFPGIPLAICFPKVHFTLIDSVGKKIQVVSEIAKALQLKNVEAINKRVEAWPKKYDFVIGRAVTALPEFMQLIKHNLTIGKKNALPNGVLYIKGGDITEEINAMRLEPKKVISISALYENQIECDKNILYFPAEGILRLR